MLASTTESELITQVASDESPETKVALYPNPVQNIINVKGLVGTETMVRICNVHGKFLFKDTVSTHNGNFQLQTENYRSGIYYMVLQSSNEAHRCKFLKH